MKLTRLFIGFFLLTLTACSSAEEKNYNILVFSKTNGFRHTDAIDAGKKFFAEQAKLNNFTAVASEDPALFTDENLKNYKAIVLLCPTGAFLADKNGNLNDTEKAALEERKTAFAKWVKNGGAIVGLHSATDCFFSKGQEWPEYWKIIGGSFLQHPHHQTCVLEVLEKEKNDPAVKFLGTNEWKVYDEWYFFQNLQRDNRVVMQVKNGTCKVGDTYDSPCYYEGGERSPIHPFVWYRTYGKGKIFYTSRGHYGKAFDEPEYQQHVMAGLNAVLKK